MRPLLQCAKSQKMSLILIFSDASLLVDDLKLHLTSPKCRWTVHHIRPHGPCRMEKLTFSGLSPFTAQCSTAIGCRRLWLSRHASPTVSFVNSSVPSTQIIACKTAINKPSVWKLESNVDVGPALGSIDRRVHQVTEIWGRWWRRCRNKRIALQLIIVDNKQSVWPKFCACYWRRGRKVAKSDY